MDSELLQRLNTAATDVERETIVLEISLSLLDDDVQTAVTVAAIPHWFDVLYLEALLGEESDDLYDELLTLSFVEQVPGKGYAIHERTRTQLLRNLWQTDPSQFLSLSKRAADYCDTQIKHAGDPEWEAEAIYHRLLSDPEEGVAGLRGLATKWANYEYHSYDEIERALRWANEQIGAGRLTGVGADWAQLWQAKLALIYGRGDLAELSLSKMTPDMMSDLYLTAEVEQTRGDVFAQAKDLDGMKTAWQTAYELYLQIPDGLGQLDAYLVVEKMRQHRLPMPKGMIKVDPEPKSTPSRNTLKLIDNIHAAWIEGVLETTLDETIDLQMDRTGSYPTNLIYHNGEGTNKLVAPGRQLSGLFDAAERSLLILGAPGSGKTITLLQLLDELLQRARIDGKAPIPLLFNLSSFNTIAQENDDNLLDWLAEQAYDQYRLKRELTREELVERRNFILLLDGLDEVMEAKGQREKCVKAINEFVQAYPCGLVVCSRIGDYEALQTELRVNHALVLQPLSNQQIDSYINHVQGPQRAERAMMRYEIENHWQLREVLRSPLLLDWYPKIFATLFAKTDEVDLTGESVEIWRKALFSAYADTVFKPFGNKNEAKAIVTKEKNIHWLSFIGDRMNRLNKSLFFIEEIQPNWLPKSLIGHYITGYRVFFVFVGLLVGAVIGLLVREQFGSIVGLTVFILVEIIVGFGVLYNSTSEIKLREKVVFKRPPRQRLFHHIMKSGFYGLIIGSILMLIIWLLYGLFAVMTGGLSMLFEPISDNLLSEDLKYISMVCLILGSSIFGIFLLIGITLAFIDTSVVGKRAKSGEGVIASIENAGKMTLFTVLIYGLIFLVISQRNEADNLLLNIIFVIILLVTFSWFGGLAWCQHWALRIVIARQGWLPLRLVPWLESMVELELLRRVGGGYIFIHRSLLEYFAELEAWKM